MRKVLCSRHLALLLALVIVGVPCQRAAALIEGGEGNTPLPDPGWPNGAAVIFNTKARVAYWVGPPFGGGEWHAECRGDAKALNAVLADFAKLDVKAKRVVLHNGAGQSFWLNMNNEAAKRAAARIDWTFTVWQPGNWERLRKLPAELNPTNPKDAEKGPPAQLDIYTGGNVKWSEEIVPKELTIVDQRLEAHGFTSADGLVLEGKTTDLATGKPLAAKVRLERVEPQKGGYLYTEAVSTTADAGGRWVLKKAPEGWLRVVVEAEGYVPRVAGYARFDDQPGWHEYTSGLARPGPVEGRLTDEAGKPLPDVEVRISDVVSEKGDRYESPLGYTVKTGADGKFRIELVPIGQASIWLHKPGYCRPGLGPKITTPKNDIALSMAKAARVVVTIDFAGKERPGAYIVRIAPEGGEKIGSYGGSGHIDAKNQMTFENVPPGRYTFTGRPNPGSDNQETEPVTIELKGGETTKVGLTAK